MRGNRRCTLGFLLVVTLALSSLSSIPRVYADDEQVTADFDSEEVAEAVVDASGEVRMEEPETPEAAEDDSTVEEAASEEEAEAAAEEEAEVVVEDEAESVVMEEATKEGGSTFLSSAKAKAVAFVDKTKEISPEQMKKVAAGALGIWGVAAGAGWVMNHFNGDDE